MKKIISAFATSIAMLFSSVVAVIPATTVNAGQHTKIDLSTTKFFPEIIDQGYENSCVACATTYYQLTYEARRAVNHYNPFADIDFSYSPASVYPLINDGVNAGSWEYKAYNALKNRGALTTDEMPYDECYDLRFFKVDEEGKRQKKYKDENNVEHEYTEPQGINIITEGEDDYNYIVSISEVKNANGQKLINDDIYEKYDVVNGKQRYIRKGEYINKEEYDKLIDNNYYVPLYDNYKNDKETGLYWHVSRTYRNIPKDKDALFNSLKIRLDSYKGWSLASPVHEAKELITDKGDTEWPAEMSQKDIEDQFIQNIKDALDNGHVVAVSTSNFNFNLSEGGTYRGTENGWVVFQNVKKIKDSKMGHEFTIVGYDDSIKCDIDDDHKTDGPGEQGAFKIANSAGTGWGNNGLVWVMYDALRIKSANNSCHDPALIYTQDSDGKWSNNTCQRHPAIEEAYIINVSVNDIKLISEVDVRAEDYYSLSVNNYCPNSETITNYLITNRRYSPVTFNGPIYTDITGLCYSGINGNAYTIRLANTNYDKKTFVKCIRLRDDKGNIVSEYSYIDDDGNMKVLTNGATLERTLDVNFEKGDLDYDNDYDINDYKIIQEYFKIKSEDIDVYEKDAKIREKFSALQLELLDSNNDCSIDSQDSYYFASKLNS